MPFDYSTVDLEGILKRAYDQMSELQRPAVGKARARGRVVFNMWMGTGKSFAALTAGFCFKPQHWLILVFKKSETTNWAAEIEKWFPEFSAPELYTIVRGQANERHTLYQRRSLFYVTTVGSFLRDIKWLVTRRIRFDVVTIDELHKTGLRNRKSQGFSSLKALVAKVEKLQPVKLINPLTGTWTSKGSVQMWPTLNLLAPTVFRSYWKFANTYNIMVDYGFGQTIIGPQNTESLALVTSPYVHHVSEADAAQHLPPLQRIILPVSLTKPEWRDYNTMARHMFLEPGEEEELITVQTVLAKLTRLRQLICCPRILSPDFPIGSVIEAIVDKIKENDELPNWKHNIVITPFVKSIIPFRSYLAEELGMSLDDIMIVQGGMEGAELKHVERRFRTDPQTMILASLKAADAWNAETALNVYFAHFDWDQDLNKQAEARSRRVDGTQKMIRSYYAHVPNSITADMFEILNRKEYSNKLTYQDVKGLMERLRARHKKNEVPPQETC